MNTKFWFATDIKTILYIIKTMVVLKIVGILLARLKYLSGSVYMLIIGVVYKYIYIKNHDFCTISIVLILYFLLVSYLQRRIKCVFKNCGYPESWRGAKAPQRRARWPPPPSPQCGAGWGEINHVTDIGLT